MAAGGSKAKEDLERVQGELANVNGQIKRIKIRTEWFPLSLKKRKTEAEERWGRNGRTVEKEIDGRGPSGHLGELSAVVGLRGGSSGAGGLSAQGLATVAVRDWSSDFTFVIGDHRYRCRPSAAQFLSPRLSKLHLIDATVSELRLEVEDGDGLFSSVLEAARGGSIAVDSAHRRTLAAICAALCNSELCQSVYPELGDKVTMENVVDRLGFLSAAPCDVSTELEFIASHFCDFLCHRDLLKNLPFALLSEILGHGSLRIDSEDKVYRFISECIETNQEVFGLLEFVRLEYCSTSAMNEFLDRLSKPFLRNQWINVGEPSRPSPPS
jgi:hypothetical protein